MRVEVEFADIRDVLAPSRPVPGKFGSVRRVVFEEYEDVRECLEQLARAGLDGNMRVFLAGTDIRVT